MRFDIERMCNLAGIGTSRSSASTSNLLRESKYYESDGFEEGNEDTDTEDDEEAKKEMDADGEVVEVDEKELVSELRRMKKIMLEAKKKSVMIAKRKKENLQEAQLKAIIDQEVKNVLKDLNLTSGWVYGHRKPTASRKGFVNQGNFLKGIGFK